MLAPIAPTHHMIKRALILDAQGPRHARISRPKLRASIVSSDPFRPPCVKHVKKQSNLHDSNVKCLDATPSHPTPSRFRPHPASQTSLEISERRLRHPNPIAAEFSLKSTLQFAGDGDALLRSLRARSGHRNQSNEWRFVRRNKNVGKIVEGKRIRTFGELN